MSNGEEVSEEELQQWEQEIARAKSRHKLENDELCDKFKYFLLSLHMRASIGFPASAVSKETYIPSNICKALLCILHTKLTESISRGVDVADNIFMKIKKFKEKDLGGDGVDNNDQCNVLSIRRFSKTFGNVLDEVPAIDVFVGYQAHGPGCKDCSGLFCSNEKHGNALIICPPGYNFENYLDELNGGPVKVFNQECLGRGLGNFHHCIYPVSEDEGVSRTYEIRYLGNELSGLDELILTIILGTHLFFAY